MATSSQKHNFETENENDLSYVVIGVDFVSERWSCRLLLRLVFLARGSPCYVCVCDHLSSAKKNGGRVGQLVNLVLNQSLDLYVCPFSLCLSLASIECNKFSRMPHPSPQAIAVCYTDQLRPGGVTETVCSQKYNVNGVEKSSLL